MCCMILGGSDTFHPSHLFWTVSPSTEQARLKLQVDLKVSEDHLCCSH